MKILFISNLFPPHYLGGYEVLCQQVCEDLEKKGHLPVVLTSVHGIEAKLKEMASRSGVQIDFTGKVDHAELPAIYREHDIFIFPSTWQEPFGLTHLEAMASGTPIISTVDGGQGEFIEDGKNAIAFEKENPHDLAKSILFLIHNPDVSRDIAVRGRSMVENRFTVDRYVNDLETFLRKAARGG